jgi:predicted nucleic acid-binding protein
LILLDTNIFLEVLLDRGKADECEALLKRVAAGEEEATVSHFSIHAIEAIIGRGEGLPAFLQSVESSLGLTVQETDTSDELAISLLSKSLNRDFDDTLQYFLAKKTGASG